MGQATLSPSGDPVLGTTMDVTIDNLPQNAAIMMTGFSNATWALGALPYDLSSLGATGCYLRVSPDFNLFVTGAGNQAVWSLPIPNVAAAAGILMYQQAVVLDPGFNRPGAVGTPGYGFVIGN